MRIIFIIFFSAIAIGFVGCAPTTMYHWGNYESKLYKHYKNPAKVERLAEALAKIIKDGESEDKVPPGIYAEYGYLLLITGHTGEAIPYFEKEKLRWPESTVLMDKMISSAKDSDNKGAGEDTKQTTGTEGGTVQ